MKITKLMDEYYKGLLLTPDIYHSLDLGIHIELGEDIYQINDDGKLNMKRFHTTYRQVAEIFPLLFKKKLVKRRGKVTGHPILTKILIDP